MKVVYTLAALGTIAAFISSGMLYCPEAAAQGGSITIQWGDQNKGGAPPPHGKGKKGGPPPHAPAHGYRAKHQYRYYPCCRVYHDTARGVWFYINAGDWAFGASLPANLQAELGHYVNISLDTEKPFEFNEEHLRQFPPEKFKKAK
ncbi:MAG: hypothetical protein WHT06_10720 [Desulfobacterales bacterium]